MEAEGRVIKATGSWFIVSTPDNHEYKCKVKGNFRIKGIRTTSPVAIGDIVTISVNPDDTAYITAVSPRKNYIIRRASNLSKESHILAANIDRAYLVVTLRDPETPLTFIDRFLATAEAYNVEVAVIINKWDILDNDDLELADAITYLYRSIGYDVLHTSALTGLGIESLKEKLRGKLSLLAGNSGVGKSSIVNAIIPEADVRTGAVSDIHHTGTHTTTFSEIYKLPDGGALIDIPGVKGFGTLDFDPAEVSHYFPEIFEISSECRYGNCTHTHEPGCAVLQALDDHKIAESRYSSYLSILEDCNPDKYRKPF